MTIYGHIWVKLICKHATWIMVYGDLQGHQLVKKMPKIWFWSLNPNYLIWCLNIMPRHCQMAIYGHIRLELMISACLLICPDMRFMVISCATIGQKYAKNDNFAPPLDPKYPIWYVNIVPGNSLLLHMVIYDWHWYVSVRFDLFRGLRQSSGEKLVKNMQKFQFYHLLNHEYPIWCLNFVPRHPHLLSMAI